MILQLENFFESFTTTWISGGWLMLPLFALAIFIYYTAIDLYLRLRSHFLLRGRVHKRTDNDLIGSLKNVHSAIAQVVLKDFSSIREIRSHFLQVRNEYLPIINRRIRFLVIIITAGPLVGLLGTVSGMLTTFTGLAANQGNKFDSVVGGISEALITTQAGLTISIPAWIILSLIVQQRNRLERCIARLEYINIKLFQTGKVAR